MNERMDAQIDAHMSCCRNKQSRPGARSNARSQAAEAATEQAVKHTGREGKRQSSRAAEQQRLAAEALAERQAKASRESGSGGDLDQGRQRMRMLFVAPARSSVVGHPSAVRMSMKTIFTLPSFSLSSFALPSTERRGWHWERALPLSPLRYSVLCIYQCSVHHRSAQGCSSTRPCTNMHTHGRYMYLHRSPSPAEGPPFLPFSIPEAERRANDGPSRALA